MPNRHTDLDGNEIDYLGGSEPMDVAVRALCWAVNGLSDDLKSISSCCGHGTGPITIWFHARSLDALLPLLYWTDECHSGEPGWHVELSTDCGMSAVVIALRGGVGADAYASANRLAHVIESQRIVPETHAFPSVCVCPGSRDALQAVPR